MWYARFNYKHNPFELDPFRSECTFVNHIDVLKDILYMVESGSMLVIEGREGTGKTMMLRQIINHFSGKGKVVYLDGKQIKRELDIEKLLTKGHMFTFPKDMILLLDNVDTLTHRNCEKIKYYFDQGYIRSVVLTTPDHRVMPVTDSIRDRIMNQIIQVPQLNKYDALRILRDRFSDSFFLPDESIMKIFKFSDNNIKQTLLNADKVCSFVVQEGRGEVLIKYVSLVLDRKIRKKELVTVKVYEAITS